MARLGMDAARLSGNAQLFHWTDYVYPTIRSGPNAPRIVATVHDVAFLNAERWHGPQESKKLEARFRRALARTDIIVCPSEASARELSRNVKLETEVEVIPFGVDHIASPDAQRGRERAAELLESTSPYAIAIGTIEPRKNHATLLAAFEQLEPSMPLLVLGAPGWESEQVIDRLRRPDTLGFPCAWLENCEDDLAFDLLAGASMLVYPSSLEGFGFPPLEALALGVPVLAGNCAALVETLGDAAVFCEGSDAEGLARSVARLGADRELRRSLVERGKQRVRSMTWQGCARRHLEIYDQVLASERSPRVGVVPTGATRGAGATRE